ncbi:major facilitator superfamily domain-containing protein [Cladorrhinum samala]|uniref:Major facilitator superfamily domain-containing protein n=1 Tax=Cladorrhinum samala TaxID=585594 RepID=A0AAV9I426_9PEZI|nr:major facilitator superfamily domain-containing protein [Cladorrhinum samala]
MAEASTTGVKNSSRMPSSQEDDHANMAEKQHQHSATDEPPSELPTSSLDHHEAQSPYSIHSSWGKKWIVLAASISAFFSPLTAQIYLPALNVLAKDFGVSSAKMNLTVTTYMIFQGVIPMFIGGFADAAGRRPAYIICFVVYIAANIGLALSKTYASLLIVRCLQSTGSAATVALCQAVVADIVTSAERGQYIGFTVLPVVLAPSLGPVIGGLLSEYLGWRWIFWFLAILASANLVFLFLFFPETCRRIVGDGSARGRLVHETLWAILKRHLAGKKHKLERHSSRQTAISFPQPSSPAFSFRPLLTSLILLFTNTELLLILLHSGTIFAGFYAITTAIPSQFHKLYPSLSDVEIGLLYLPIAGGSIAAAFFCGPALGWNYRRHAKRVGLEAVDKNRQVNLTKAKFPIERARLEIGSPLLALSIVVMLTWGWAVEYSGGLAAPCVLLFLFGVGMIGFNNSANALIVDISPGNAGAAVAAGNLTRCLLGAVASAVIVPLLDAIGSGWTYTLFAGLYLAVTPMLWVVVKRGLKWREEWDAKEEAKKRKMEGEDSS